jgi:hypothetical protein
MAKVKNRVYLNKQNKFISNEEDQCQRPPAISRYHLEAPTTFEDINIQNSIQEQRRKLQSLPQRTPFEIPGRPHVCYELFKYKFSSIQKARREVDFLFKAFENSRETCHRGKKKKSAEKSRTATIREFMNWTVGGNPEFQHEAWSSYPQDFEGFIIICLRERFRPQWPAPKENEIEFFPNDPRLGADKSPMPFPRTQDKPIVAATIRAGSGYMEIPFFATTDRRKAKGFGRCLKEAIEEVARGLDINKLMLCSEGLSNTQTIWSKMGFRKTYIEDIDELVIRFDEILHMGNTVQMHKVLATKRRWKTCSIKHKHMKQRVYYI